LHYVKSLQSPLLLQQLPQSLLLQLLRLCSCFPALLHLLLLLLLDLMPFTEVFQCSHGAECSPDVSPTPASDFSCRSNRTMAACD
jgi:hypothetical protein